MKRVTINFEDGEQTVTIQDLFQKKFELYLRCQSLLSCSTRQFGQIPYQNMNFLWKGSILVS